MAIGYFSTYASRAVLEHILGVASLTSPAHLYVALSTADPGESGAGITEPVAMGYARTVHDDWTVSDEHTATNASDITFALATGVWGTISHFAVYDALTGGNMLFYGPVDTGKMVQSGDTATFFTGDFVIFLD